MPLTGFLPTILREESYTLGSDPTIGKSLCWRVWASGLRVFIFRSMTCTCRQSVARITSNPRHVPCTRLWANRRAISSRVVPLHHIRQREEVITRSEPVCQQGRSLVFLAASSFIHFERYDLLATLRISPRLPTGPARRSSVPDVVTFGSDDSISNHPSVSPFVPFTLLAYKRNSSHSSSSITPYPLRPHELVVRFCFKTR